MFEFCGGGDLFERLHPDGPDDDASSASLLQSQSQSQSQSQDVASGRDCSSPGGSDEDDLDGHHGNYQTKALSAEARFRVAAYIAEGLEYLHCAAYPPVIHRDVKR